MFFFLSKLLDVFLSPYTWALLLFACAVPWNVRQARRWRRRRWFGVGAFAVLALASNHVVDNALACRLEASATTTFDPAAHYDVVIVLGGMTDERITAERGAPALNEQVERVLVAYDLLREGKATTAIISGGAVDPKLIASSEARVLAKMLRDFGIAEERLVVEDQAMNTRENATRVAAIMRERGFERALLVTSAYHMPRSVECFRAVGLRFDTLPVDHRGARTDPVDLQGFLPRARSLANTTAWLRELFGRLVYRVVGFGA